MNYKDLALEEIEKRVKEVFDKMTQAQKDDFFVKDLGSGMYRLPGGALCNKAGLKMFQEAVLQEGKKMIFKLKKDGTRSKN